MNRNYVVMAQRSLAPYFQATGYNSDLLGGEKASGKMAYEQIKPTVSADPAPQRRGVKNSGRNPDPDLHPFEGVHTPTAPLAAAPESSSCAGCLL
ncbi:hypothetical protein KM043_010240 [Ampulex compressa]|nr:hypothetical protein KM043_010240 [Ampulex compressa]